MKVLITGASGFIGRNVVLRTPRDWEVVALYHDSPGLVTLIDRHKLAHVRAIGCDLTSPSEVSTLTRETSPFDACLYLAANGDPARSAVRPAWDLQRNTLGLVTLLEHILIGHLVYVSSGAVYDGLKGRVTPASLVAPWLPYAISKLASEHYVRAFAERAHTVGSYINVRFFGAFGPYEPERKITTRLIRVVMAGQRDFAIRGNGENLIDFMYVDDAVDGLLKLVSSPGWSGTLDFASGSPLTVNEVVRAIARVLAVEVHPVHEGHAAEYIEFQSADPTMRDRFGVTAKIPLEEGVRRLQRFLLRETSGAGQPA